MGLPPERPISDPLLRPEEGPRDALGKPVRAPLGNSIRTFVIFVVLIAIGVAIWWLRRPDDLSTSIGGREWTITAVDGEPATNAAGTVSTFVLDGNGEIRAAVDCNISSGKWAYDEQRSHLSIEWEEKTALPCADDWPSTFRPVSGQVSVEGDVMRISTATRNVRAVSLADTEPAAVDDIAGSWVAGGRTIVIGPRGRFEIDDCEGSWEGMDDSAVMDVEFEDLQRAGCDLPAMWRDDTPLVPVLDDGALYLRRDRSVFPLDRAIVRLDPET